MLKIVDSFLNSITMYRVVLYGLLLISGVAILLGFAGVISYSGPTLLLSLFLLITACYCTNRILSLVLKAPINVESSLITALILFLVLEPSFFPKGIIACGVFAMASKYLFAIRKKHLFNPAAITMVIMGLIGFGAASWWVATPMLSPVVAIVGLLVVRKIRRFTLLFSFLVSAMISIYIFQASSGNGSLNLFLEMFSSWPLVFFATIMLTEPLTTPHNQRLRVAYGVLVGALFGVQFSIGPLYSTPELALVLGNIFSYVVNPKYRVQLTLKGKKQLSPKIWDFTFASNKKLSFLPGQYLEWTLPHKNPDRRGNRRYFTIASAPTEKEIHLGVRISDKKSSFKKSLLELTETQPIVASQLTGDFVLPQDRDKKLVFIAGGIGVTPFRSMAQYLIDIKEKRDIVLFYTSSSPKDFVYKELFDKAKSIEIRTVYILTHEEETPTGWTGKKGHLSEEMIRSEVDDYKNRTFYLSGPQAMVDTYKKLLSRLSIPKKNIVTDYFPGF